MGCGCSKIRTVEDVHHHQRKDSGLPYSNGNGLLKNSKQPSPRSPRDHTAVAVDDDASDFASEGQHSNDSDWDDYLVQQSENLFTQPSNSAGAAGGLHRAATSSSSMPDVQESPMGVLGIQNDKNFLEPLKETSSLRLSKLRGCTFVNQYVVIKYLGRGASGRVFLCMNINTTKLYAVKIVKKGALEAQLAARPGGAQGAAKAGQNHKRKRTVLEDLLAEISVMRNLQHRNIVSLREVVDDPGSNKLLLVMDYMEGGPVMTREALDKGHRIPEAIARQYFRDMIKALDYLHHNKIVHGDLKPENVLMSAKGNVALSDFGCSKVIVNGDDTLDRCNGTPAFLAPEMMKPNSKYRGRPADIYALGACLFTFVFGRIPFNAPSVVKLFQVVQTQPLRFPEGMKVSSALYALLSAMLEKDPDKRITLRQIMVHPWVTMEGRWPCKSIRDLKTTKKLENGEVINTAVLDTLLADDPMPVNFLETANVVDLPAEDWLSPVALEPAAHEQVLQPGDYLIKQGETGTNMYFIVEGELEVTIKLRSLGSRPLQVGGKPPAASSSGEADTMDRADAQADTPVEELPSTIVEAALRAQEMISARRVGKREFMVSSRKPGEFVGIMALFSAPPVRCASVRARSRVRVKVVQLQQLLSYLSARPEAKNQLQQLLWSRQSENLVVEALAHLSLITEVLEDLLTTHRDMTDYLGDA